MDTCTVELSESERRSGWKLLASVLGDAAAAFGCVNRVEELVKQFLSDCPPFLTRNNRTTIGFFKAARECGICIGQDIALIGIDHISLLDDLGIPFSCVARDSKSMGREAVNILLGRIESDTITGRKIVTVPYKIILNGSEKRSIECLI